MKTIEELDQIIVPDEIQPHPDAGGQCRRYTFDNGWGASVVCHGFSYGGDEGLFELAVLKGEGLHYDNRVAQGDVRGCLEPSEVEELLLDIMSFEPAGTIKPAEKHRDAELLDALEELNSSFHRVMGMILDEMKARID